MATTMTDALAQIIRKMDGNNDRSPQQVGQFAALFLARRDLIGLEQTPAVIAFVERTNPDKRMGAGRLAELIVTEFRLDEEN